jgi:hypothetical protein
VTAYPAGYVSSSAYGFRSPGSNRWSVGGTDDIGLDGWAHGIVEIARRARGLQVEERQGVESTKLSTSEGVLSEVRGPPSFEDVICCHHP